MSDQDQQNPQGQGNVQFHVLPDLEYVYRDVFNIFVGPSDVVIEFGNHHRSVPGRATISNRIVLSLGNANALSQAIQQALQEAQQKMREGLNR